MEMKDEIASYQAEVRKVEDQKSELTQKIETVFEKEIPTLNSALPENYNIPANVRGQPYELRESSDPQSPIIETFESGGGKPYRVNFNDQGPYVDLRVILIDGEQAWNNFPNKVTRRLTTDELKVLHSNLKGEKQRIQREYGFGLELFVWEDTV